MLVTPLIAAGRKYKKALLILAFVVLLVFAGVRYGFGNDFFSYEKNYDAIQNGGTSSFEKQVFFNLLLRYSPSFSWVIFITSVLTIVPVYKLISKYVAPEIAWVSVFIYCINPYLFLMSLSALRQSLATSMFIFAVFFAFKRKLIPYVILILCATLFHTSAIVLLPFYFVANDRKVSVKLVVIFTCLFLALFFSAPLLDNVAQFVLDIFDNKQYDYYYDQGATNSVRATILSSFYLVYILINLPRLEGATLMCSKLYLLGCFFSVLAFRLSMLTRLQMYFDIFSLVSLPMILLENIKLNEKSVYTLLNKYILPALMFIVYFLRYYSFFTNPLWEPFYNYETIVGNLI